MDNSTTYSVALSTYIANGGDGFDMFGTPLSQTSLGMTVAVAASNYLAAVAPEGAGLRAAPEGRITRTFTPPTVHLGVLLPMFLRTSSGRYVHIRKQSRRAVYQAILEINNKADGVADWLLPRTQIRFAYRDSK